VTSPTFNAYQTSKSTSPDAYLCRISISGSSLEFSTFLGGKSDDRGLAILVTDSGNTYLTGDTQSIDFYPLKAPISPHWPEIKTLL